MKESTNINITIPGLTESQLEECINNGISYIDKINDLILDDINQQYLRTLLNRINRAIEYVEACYMDDELLKILKGERL